MAFNFTEYLQSQLGLDFFVSKELNNNADPRKIMCVVSQHAGANYDNSSDIPFQLDFYTCNPQTDQPTIDQFGRSHNNVFITDGVDKIRQSYSTSVIMEKDIVFGNNHFVRICVFARLFTMNNVSDVQLLSIGSENIEFLSVGLSYVAQPSSTRVSGSQLNYNKKLEAGIVLTFQMISRVGNFFTALRSLRKGTIDGNTIFAVKMTWTDNASEESYNMIVVESAFAGNRLGLPTYNIKMLLTR
jgi:hypothetical protein